MWLFALWLFVVVSFGLLIAHRLKTD